MVKIKKISKRQYKGKVYDLSLDSHESPYFYANRILTHNSLYPHIMMMFNIFGNPVTRPDCKEWFTGNDVFKVTGKYAIDKQHKLSKEYQHMYKERKLIKHTNPEKAYAYKIILNGGYGVLRSKLFKSLYYENSGYDICWIGQQLNEMIGDFFEAEGFKTIFGDTDSRGLKYIREPKLTIDEQYKLIEKINKKMNKYIMDNVPYPSDTFDLESETGALPVEYFMFVPDEKTGKFKKKNYAYIYNDKGTKKVKIMGLPIKKSNATELGMKIFHKHIEPKMLSEVKGKFDSEWIANLIKDDVVKDIEQMAVEYKCSPFDTYAVGGRNGINAQTSLNYLDSKGGQIRLLKNKSVGKVGKKFKYCTLEEAREAKLTYKDLDLTKVFKELYPFSNTKIEFVRTKKFF